MKALLIALIFIQQVNSPQKSQPEKIKLAISATCNDPVGELFLYHFREEIRSSAGYELDNKAAYTVNLVCMDASGEGYSGLSSAISVVVVAEFTLDKCSYTWLQDQEVMQVGRDKTKLMAARLLAGIDKSLH